MVAGAPAMEHSGTVATVRRRPRVGGGRKMGVVKWIVGTGFWVQGFRVFPNMGISFFLKDVVGVSPWALQLLNSSSTLPMVAKPVYGVLSDAVYICGQHRLPYVAIGALLQAASWLTLLILPESSFSVLTLAPFLIVGNIGAAVAEVANDAIVTEIGRQSSKSQSIKLQSFAWMSAAFAGAVGNLVGGIAVNRLSPRSMFQVFILLLSLQFLSTIAFHEKSLDLPTKAGHSSISFNLRKKTSELSIAMRKPEISSSIAWFFLSLSVIPLMTGTMFYYNTQYLGVQSSTIGISRVVGQGLVFVWTATYCQKLIRIPPRKVLSALQIAMAVLVASNILFVKGFFRALGVPDAVYVVSVSGVLEEFFHFKELPFIVLIAQLCPAGCEASVMAFLMSSVSLALIISRYFGVGLVWFMGITGTNFDGLVAALLIQTAFIVLPLYWSSWIPDINAKQPARSKQE